MWFSQRSRSTVRLAAGSRRVVPVGDIIMHRLLAILSLTVVAGGAANCSTAADRTERPPRSEAVPVSVASAVVADISEPLEAGGVVSAVESAAVSSRILATVTAVRVQSGDRVSRGDVLMTLDAPDTTARTDEARAGALAAERALTLARSEVETAEAERRMAAAWHQRIAALHARNSATDQERDEAETRLATAVARRAGAEAGVDVAEARLTAARAAVNVASAAESYATLRAPFDGVISERLVDPGSLASPGVPLVRIESSGARQILVRVDAARVPFIQPGDHATIESDTPDEPHGDGGTIEGVVTEVARAIGTDQQAFTVKLLAPRTFAARSGSFARVIFRGARRRALLVPANAVVTHGQVSTLYVVEQGVARVRLIQMGASLPGGIEILAGLDAGEPIVTAPPARLADGVSVTAIGAADNVRGGR
jgi:RND family efflux transporter MFP subunit